MEKEKIIISVVIPVYKAEKYISRLIESLKAQTFKDLEFIFVDDLGNDRSMDIVSDWARIDSRVKIVVNEKNLGEGGSRNRGMEEACGTYINNIDPDDWLSPDYYELLYAKAVETSADIVKGTRIGISEEDQKEIMPRSKLNQIIIDGLSKGEPLFYRLNYEHTTVMFRRDLLDKDTKYGKSGNAADTTFLLKLCWRHPSIAVEDKAYYYYLRKADSATGEFSLKRSRNELISLEEMIDHFVNYNSFDEYVYMYLSRRYKSYSSRFIRACEEKKIFPWVRKRYIADFKEQFLRIPDYEKLYKCWYSMFAFIRLDIILTDSLDRDISINRKRCADWITYLLALEQEKQKKDLKKAQYRFKSMLTSYIEMRKEEGVPHKVIKQEILRMKSGVKGAKGRKLFDEIINSFFA